MFTRVFDALGRPSRRMGAAPCFETPRNGASDTCSPPLEARLLSMRPIEICVISCPALLECVARCDDALRATGVLSCVISVA